MLECVFVWCLDRHGACVWVKAVYLHLCVDLLKPVIRWSAQTSYTLICSNRLYADLLRPITRWSAQTSYTLICWSQLYADLLKPIIRWSAETDYTLISQDQLYADLLKPVMRWSVDTDYTLISAEMPWSAYNWMHFTTIYTPTRWDRYRFYLQSQRPLERNISGAVPISLGRGRGRGLGRIELIYIYIYVCVRFSIFIKSHTFIPLPKYTQTPGDEYRPTAFDISASNDLCFLSRYNQDDEYNKTGIDFIDADAQISNYSWKMCCSWKWGPNGNVRCWDDRVQVTYDTCRIFLFSHLKYSFKAQAHIF